MPEKSKKRVSKRKCKVCSGTGQKNHFGGCYTCGKCQGTGKYDLKQPQDFVNQVLRSLKK